MAHTRQFAADEMIQQRFPFKQPLLKYIFDNINYKHLHKLYQCCKFFPNKFPLIIIRQTSDILQTFNGSNEIFTPQTKIWLPHKSHFSLMDPKLRQWISKISICTIQDFRALENISLNDFEILTSSKSIEELHAFEILNKNGMPLSVEDIVSYVPNASIIVIFDAFATLETFSKLVLLKRKAKLTLFQLNFYAYFLYEIKKIVIPDEYLKFIEVHASKDESRFYFGFNGGIPDGYVKDLNTTIKCKIFYGKEFKTFTHKPRFDASVLRY